MATASPGDSVMLAQTLQPSEASKKTDEAIIQDVDGTTLIREYISKARKGSISSVFTIFFLTLGPLKIVPIFVSLTANADDTLRKKMAFRGFWISTLVVMLISLVGIEIVDKYGIPISALMMAAGIVLFLVSLGIIMTQYGSAAPPPSSPENPSLDLVVTPLIFPTILTPYGIAIVMLIMSILKKVIGHEVLVLGLLMVIMVLNLLSMLYARQILKVLKPSILKVIGLVLGMVQLSLGITWIFTAIRMEVLVIRSLLTS
ncbi:MAG: MarC family protein [Okeania sp. SIO1H6]|nr:MarC family protein [Okeania sp. SIO1H6]